MEQENKKMDPKRKARWFSSWIPSELNGQCINQTGERYYLCLLLQNIPNPTSYRFLSTVNGTEYSTFQQACQALGLFVDDQTWEKTMTEAATFYAPKTVQSVFAQLLRYAEIQDPLSLWTNHILSMSLDYQREHEKATGIQGITREIVKKVVMTLKGFSMKCCLLSMILNL
jgi:hypothetical protein